MAQMIQMRAQQTLAKPSAKSTASAGFKPKPDTQPKKVSTTVKAKDDVPMEDDKSPSKTFVDSNSKMKDKHVKSYQEDDDLNLSDLDED